MSNERLFLDTSFIQAFLNVADAKHAHAVNLFPRVRVAKEVWTTEAILVEVGNAFSKSGPNDRLKAANFIRNSYTTPNMHVVPVDTELLKRATDLYAARLDKTWGITDCISFVVMKENGLLLALTGDRDFQQAGFHALMLDKI